jgi:hypothetical protein
MKNVPIGYRHTSSWNILNVSPLFTKYVLCFYSNYCPGVSPSTNNSLQLLVVVFILDPKVINALKLLLLSKNALLCLDFNVQLVTDKHEA